MLKKLVLFSILSLFLTSCEAFKPKKVNTREVPINAEERARKNIKEGRGVSLKGIMGGGGSTNYEFSTSNPLWRASLEILDFLPLTTVDYSGGMIITDWYSDNAKNDESLKISVRFMSNELRSDSLKILVHRKNCKISDNCAITLLPNNSKINSELLSVILQKAALLKEASKKKTKTY